MIDLKRVYVGHIINGGHKKLYKIFNKYDIEVNRIEGETFYGRFIQYVYKKNTTELTFTDGISERIVIGHNDFYSVELSESIKESITMRDKHIPSLQSLAKMKLYSNDIEELRKHYPNIFI
jgi:hypothetical protein